MNPSPYYKQDFKMVSQIKKLTPTQSVFLIEVDDGSHLVIKQEQAGTDAKGIGNLKFANNMMKQVSDGYMGKPLKPSEVSALKDFVDDSQRIAAAFEVEEEMDAKDLRTYIGSNRAWVKMQKIEGMLTLENAIKEMMGDAATGTPGSKTGVRKIAASLNAVGGFEKFGEIVAVDLFIQNTDRFRPFGGGRPNPRTGQEFKTLINIGNIVTVIRDGIAAGKMVGMDAYDPSTDMGRISNADNLPKAGEALWGDDVYTGHLLSSTGKKELLQYFKNICQDLEDAWGPRNRKFFLSSKKRLSSNGPTRMMAGAESAKQKIRTKMISMLNKPGAPTAAITARLKILNA